MERPQTPNQKGSKVLGMEFAPLNIPISRRLQMVSILFWFFIFFVVTLTSYPIIIYLLCFSSYDVFRRSAAILLPYLWWIWVVDRDACNKSGRSIAWVRNWPIWKWFNSYFPINVVKTCELNPKRNYLFGSHPHGILCNGAFGTFATNAQNIQKLFPGFSFHILTLQIFFRVPIVRDLILSLGTCAATRHGMNHLLSTRGGGQIAVLIPGGAPESLDCHPGTAVVQLKNKKGFIKVALQNGTPLVPCYSFGEVEIFSQPANPKGSFLRKIQELIMAIVQIPPIFLQGRGVFQYTYGFLPHRRPITVVIGAPIELEQVEKPTQEMIDKLHAKYVDALVELFYKQREKYAPDPNQVISVV